jgi:uncharacterized protein YPO0396
MNDAMLSKFEGIASKIHAQNCPDKTWEAEKRDLQKQIETVGNELRRVLDLIYSLDTAVVPLKRG